jgi:hypothetical protein
VWLAQNRGRAWSCDQCKTNPKLRKQRGNCGGRFEDGLPLAQRDELGLWVPGYRVAPDCGEDFSDYQIRSCPVAGANKMAPIIRAYQRHRAGLYPIKDQYPKPSCALLEAVDVLHSNTEEAHIRAHEKIMKEANHG